MCHYQTELQMTRTPSVETSVVFRAIGKSTNACGSNINVAANMSIRRADIFIASIRFFHHFRLSVTRIEPSSGALRYGPSAFDLLGMATRPRSRRHHLAGTPLVATEGLYLPNLVYGACYVPPCVRRCPEALVPSEACDRNTKLSRTNATAKGHRHQSPPRGKLTGTAPWRGRPPSGRCSR